MQHNVLPPLARKTPIERILSPFARFAHTESAGGIVLIACTIVAVVWANSPWAEAYHHLWELPIGVSLNGAELSNTLHHWINDGLMAVFFFLVGLEIKREALVGELASLRKAALPIAGAIGGMVVPALFYRLLNPSGPAADGWGVPMATDIAFALGVLALMGPRVPLALKVFLTALAIADDIGAVLVIALFYSAGINWMALAAGFVMLGVMALTARLGVRKPWVYLILGILVWLAFLQSGVHATVAGVLAALTIPVRTRIDTREFLDRGRILMEEFDAAGIERRDVLTNPRQAAVIEEIENTCEQAQSPLQRIEHSLHLTVAFFIIPLFALANAGVHVEGDVGEALLNRVTLGIVAGLVLGKVLGITLFSWVAVKLKLAALPRGVSWFALQGVAWLGGIGFTMSLFISSLAFESAVLVAEAKVGIFLASLLAGIMGWLMIRRLPVLENEDTEDEDPDHAPAPHPAPAV